MWGRGTCWAYTRPAGGTWGRFWRRPTTPRWPRPRAAGPCAPLLPDTAHIGTTFSCSYLTPHRPGNALDEAATRRADALLNRFFVEPALGLGYPVAELPALRWLLERYQKPGDDQRMPFRFRLLG